MSGERGIDYINMPLPRMQGRYLEIKKSLAEIAHGPERRAQLEFEFGSIILEMWCKHRDGEVEFILPESFESAHSREVQ